MGDSAMKLPKYKCHKEVRAAKIVAVENGDDGKARVLTVRIDGNDHRIVPGEGWWKRAAIPDVTAIASGYYVQYDDNYASWSPAKAFEDGYTRVVEPQPPTEVV